MTSIPDVTVSLRRLKKKAAGPAARDVAKAMGTAYQRDVVIRELSRYSHPPGTGTPSPPGFPPARVTGQLAISIRTDPPIQVGSASWKTRVGPTAVYGRIQELGGVTGRNHATRLPPRPYLRPARNRMVANGSLQRVAIETFRRHVTS